jgi:hypothetical protein
MDIASVTIAGASIDPSVRLRATAVAIADAKLHTAGSGSRTVQKDGGKGV